MRKAVVGFEVPIERIEAKAKLSPEKPNDAGLGAADALAGGDHPHALEIARLMHETGPRRDANAN